MTALIIIGDIIISAFLCGLAAWLFICADDKEIEKAARIPLEDDEPPPGDQP